MLAFPKTIFRLVWICSLDIVSLNGLAPCQEWNYDKAYTIRTTQELQGLIIMQARRLQCSQLTCVCAAISCYLSKASLVLSCQLSSSFHKGENSTRSSIGGILVKGIPFHLLFTTLLCRSGCWGRILSRLLFSIA